MAVGNMDVLQVNLTLVGADLVNDVGAVPKFHQAVLAEITTNEAEVGPGLRGRRLELKRDRITIVGDSSRSVVTREYPAKVDLERFAQVASAAIGSTDLTGQTLTTYGYNIDVAYDLDPAEPAIKYLVDRCFARDIFQNWDRAPLGGYGRVLYEKGGFHWTVVFEPRGLDLNSARVFLNFNLVDTRKQVDPVSFPMEEEILDSVRLLWEEAHDFITQLDGSKAGG